MKVRQVILNLLSNAIKFTEKRGIRIAAKNRAEPAGIVFTVQDTGIGMREEDIPTIFDPFRQTDGSITRQAGGTGLGLAIVKNILDALQGKHRGQKLSRHRLQQMEKACRNLGAP